MIGKLETVECEFKQLIVQTHRLYVIKLYNTTVSLRHRLPFSSGVVSGILSAVFPVVHPCYIVIHIFHRITQ